VENDNEKPKKDNKKAKIVWILKDWNHMKEISSAKNIAKKINCSESWCKIILNELVESELVIKVKHFKSLGKGKIINIVYYKL